MTKLWISLPVSALALAGAGVLGSAGADPPAVPAGHTLSVNGAGARDVQSDAGRQAFQTAYSAALDDAIADAKAKAAHVAQQSGVTLGAIDSVSETSNSTLDGCYTIYASGNAVAAPARRPTITRRGRPQQKPRAASAAADMYTCPVQAAVRISYTLAG